METRCSIISFSFMGTRCSIIRDALVARWALAPRARMGSPNRSRHRLPCDPRQPQNPSNIHPLTFANPAPQKSIIASRRPQKLRIFAVFGPKVPKTRPLNKVANCTTRRPKQDTARTCPSASPHHFQKKKRFPPVMEMSGF